MHSNSRMQTCRGSAKVAVLDTIHGASTIAQRMCRSGIDASAFEVYHQAPSISGFDLVVTPVHLSPENPALAEAKRLHKRIITHHMAVGELLIDDLKPDLKIFEVTGIHSKTTTALLLARIISSNMRVISHSTRGIELWSNGSSKTLQTGLSITPANVIRAVETADTNNADALVCEVSLGGTGLADYGILTSLSGDYRIAGGTKWASTAKLQLLSLAKPGSKVVANADAKISSDISFGHDGYIIAKPNEICFGHDKAQLALGADLDFESYETAISASAAAAYYAGLSIKEIADALEGFDGISGRMKVTRSSGISVYDCSNSGLKVSDVKHVLDLVTDGKIGLVVGEEAETVCEGINVPSLVELLCRYRNKIDLLVLVGRRLDPWAKELRAKQAQDLKTGESLARLSASELDKLLLCVKCFR
ncbi:MAG: coenzyme F430 synthase [Methanotrichaceae archaeon]